MSLCLSSELTDPPPTSPANPPASSPPGYAASSSSSNDDTPRGIQASSDDEHSPTQQHCRCCGHRFMRESQKLAYIFTLFRRWRWNLLHLLQMVYTRRTQPRYRKPWLDFRRGVRDPTSSYYEEFSPTERADFFASHIGWDWVIAQLREELEQVSCLAAFGTFNIESRGDNTKLLTNALGEVEQVAPRLSNVLRHLDHPSWATKRNPAQLTSRHLLMLSIMCTCLHRTKCTLQPTHFAFDLANGGASKRLIDLYNQMGVCVSYNQLRKMHNKIADQAGKEVCEPQSAPAPQKFIVSYDNFEYQDSKGQERIGSATKFMSITTAVACVPCGLPSPQDPSVWHHPTIKQSMLKDTANFSIHYYNRQLLPRDQLQEIDRFFLIQAIRDTFPNVLQQSVFKKQRFPLLPTLQRIPPQRTQSFPLEAIFKSESTTQNTQYIIDHIFVKARLKLKEDHPQFSEDARIVVGDLKTLNLILGLKTQREETTEGGGYELYKWLIPNLGLFHLRLNMLQLIHGAHWGGTTETVQAQWDDYSTLQWQADMLNCSRRTRSGKEVQAVDELIRHSFNARVTAMFVQVLREMVENCDIKSGQIERKTVEDWLKQQSNPQTFYIVLDEVRKRLFEPPATVDTDPELDDEHQNHIRFIQHVRPYLLLKWSIQHADLGLLRQAMRECCILFQAPNGGKGNYAREMIRYLQLVDSEALPKEVADYILLNALVNPSGRSDGWYPMDQHLEFINLNIRNGLTDNRSSYDKEKWIRNNVLNIPFLRKVQRMFEITLGTTRDGRHSRKAAHNDIWNIANHIQGDSSIIKMRKRLVAHAAPDLRGEGLQAFPSNVYHYNRRHTKDWIVGDLTTAIESQPPDPDSIAPPLCNLAAEEAEFISREF